MRRVNWGCAVLVRVRVIMRVSRVVVFMGLFLFVCCVGIFKAFKLFVVA